MSEDKCPLITSFLDNFCSAYTEHSRPPILYHYTSLDSFLSIIKGEQLWASEISLMNDNNEFIILYEFISNIYNKKNSTPLPGVKFRPGILSPDYNTVWYTLNNFLNQYSRREYGNTFVFSMSSEPDLLSQWRAYASDGNGVCIGFNADYFREIETDKQFLKECFYFDLRTQENVSRIVDSIFYELDIPPRNGGILSAPSTKDHKSKADSLSGSDLRDYQADLTREFFDCIDKLSFYVKNDAFSEEREWRFILKGISTDESVQYYSKKDKMHMVNTIEIPKMGAITEVIIGPGKNSIRNEFVIRNFLRKIERYDISIRKSKIPYNN